ncbi:MAG: glycosyltransferase family 87 protein [Saprospiraceae bacterium]|nr:glycosyltransferase family 87 protein [Saprospiraceae bacterium]MDG2419926.1 glycosyltransferase family 87 protein [Saprospiraceae bacterium]
MKKIFENPRFIFGVYMLLALSATLQSYYGSPTIFNDLEYTAYNNYLIFKQSFFHLIEGKDLFILYPKEHWDLYKYSPTFSLMMAPLAILPDVVGLFIWNLLNALVLFFGIKKLQLPARFKGIEFSKISMFIILFVGLELMTSLQNEQSNGLLAGLIILAFVFLEKEKIWLGTLCITLTFYIKIFGIVAFALFLVYPQKGKFILSSAVWVIVLGLLPAVFVGFDQLIFLYGSWGRMLGEDHAASYGYSVMGWLQIWFGLEVSKNVIVLLGVALFCLPLVKFKRNLNYEFRWRLLVSILIWVVIFNHKAESPTFVIAMSGVGIWYFFSKKTKVNLALVILAFVFTSLSPTDLFPRFLRESFVIPYVMKAMFCILIWGKVIWEMFLIQPQTNTDLTDFSKVE